MDQKNKPIVILMAEDDPDDRMFSSEALDKAHLTNELRFVEDGQELIDYLHCRGKYSNREDCPTPGLSCWI